MNETAISWTVSNWITVFLMVMLGSLMLGAAIVTYKKVQSKASAS